ncbi:MAG TPA: M48 family metalloprotease [Candidatus Acidoferrales bacterium]|nr:M48 family metalloprotease [Candidatus Acidoferrales bacterium]
MRLCRLVLLVLIVVGVAAASSPASAHPSFADRRVSAIPDAALLSAPPQTLLDPRRQAVSLHLSAWTRPLFFAWAFSMIGMLFHLWNSGSAASMRDALRRRIRSPLLLRFVFGGALAGIVGLAQLPVAFVRYRVASVYDLTSEPIVAWLQDSLTTIVLDSLIAGLVVAAVMTAVAKTRLWYLYTAAGIVVFSFGLNFIQPVLIAPLYNSYRPLAATSSLYRPIRTLEQRAGLGDAPIVIDNQSRQTDVINANVAGFGSTRRIVVSDNLIENATPREIFFILSHEMGHSVHGDILRLTLVGTGLLLLVATIAVTIADRIGVRRDDDPLSRLALVGALLGIAALIAYPVFNSYSRKVEARADAFGVALTGDRAAAVRTFVRFADEGLAPYCPPALVRAYFYDHPPVGSRIAAALGRPDPCP